MVSNLLRPGLPQHLGRWRKPFDLYLIIKRSLSAVQTLLVFSHFDAVVYKIFLRSNPLCKITIGAAGDNISANIPAPVIYPVYAI
jgi:hypothetical protein